MKFTKMHGIGNDYVYIDCFKETVKDPQALAVKWSDRHKGIGGDGVILIMPSDKADFRMRMFNADGSEGKMCGNGTRCVGKYVYDRGLTDKTEITLETLSGIKYLTLHPENGKVRSVTVDMGLCSFRPQDIPIKSGSPLVKAPLEVCGKNWDITCVSMGNPHCVIFTDSIDSMPLEQIGPQFENHPLFPERVNTEFVETVDSTHLKMRVWERGSGETMACGTGACATVAAAVKCGICAEDTPVTVSLLGGDLEITCSGGRLLMTGPAEIVFDGEIKE